jgi:hypothetical protein
MAVSETVTRMERPESNLSRCFILLPKLSLFTRRTVVTAVDSGPTPPCANHLDLVFDKFCP